MINLSIEYHPFELQPFISQFFPLPDSRIAERSVPSSWSELSLKQYLAVRALQREEIDDKKFLMIFLDLQRGIADNISPIQRYFLIKNFSFMNSLRAVDFFFIKEIAGFNSPGVRFKGVTFGAFVFGDTYFQRYDGENDAVLNKFIACFYLDEQGFEENSIDSRAGKISSTPAEIREAIIFNYLLIREWLALNFPYVFEKREKSDCSNPEEEKTAFWVRVFDHVVGKDIINQDKYALLPATEVLRFINERMKEYYKNGSKF